MKKILFLILIYSPFIFAQSSKKQENFTKYSAQYYCPPCNCEDDGKHFDAPGDCSSCNMTLQMQVKGLEDKPIKPSPRRTAAIVLFNGADIMDVTGPMSVFEHAGFNVVTVAKDSNSKTIGMYTPLKPNYTFKTLPKVDVIMIPGGGPAEGNQDMEIVNWLKERDNSTDTMFSVCSGAFFLGLAGILDGNEATTFAMLIPNLKEQFPKANVLNNVKYTNNGHVITSSGLSSGIDASFEVVAKYFGVGYAQDVANRMEYPWKRRNDYARTQLADNYITSLRGLMNRFATDFYYSEGDMNSWESRLVLWNQVNQKEFLSFINNQISKMDGYVQSHVTKNSILAIIDHKNLGRGQISISLKQSKKGTEVILKSEREKEFQIAAN